MRVTFNSINDGLASVTAAAAALDRAQDQVATGKRLRVPSDDPLAAARTVRGRAELAGLDAYTRASDAAAARLAAIDGALTGIIEQLTAARVAVASAQSSTAGADAREAAALKLEGLRDSLLGQINLRVNGTALFGGGQSLVTPYTRIGGVWTYQGDGSPVAVAIGNNRTVSIALDGRAILQGGDTTDILTTMEATAAAIRAGDQAGMDAGMAALDRAFARATRAQSLVGADLAGVEEEQAQVRDLRVAGQRRISKDEDANLAEAISNMNRAETAYRAALGVVGAAGRLSLMDYLR